MLTTKGIDQLIERIRGREKDVTKDGSRIRVYLSEIQRQSKLREILTKKLNIKIKNIKPIEFLIKINKLGKTYTFIPKFLAIRVKVKTNNKQHLILLVDFEIIQKIITGYGTSLLVDLLVLYYQAVRISMKKFSELAPDDIRIHYYDLLTRRRYDTKKFMDDSFRILRETEQILDKKANLFKKFSKEYMNIFNSFQQLLKQDITNALRKDPLRILDNV
ncbi:MAG: hypothetical protein ACTSVW_02780, partial [Candidatus Njordarchaeales archaeon]